MLADFHRVVKACPPPSRVGEIARAKVDELMYAVYSEDADVAGRDSPPPSPDRPGGERHRGSAREQGWRREQVPVHADETNRDGRVLLFDHLGVRD
jgi:hypothetical protein